MASRFSNPNIQFSDATGAPYAGGTLSFYASGTSAPLSTFSDTGLTVANTNPVILDSAGRAGSIFLSASTYKVVLEDANGVQIWSEDPVGADASAVPQSTFVGASTGSANNQALNDTSFQTVTGTGVTFIPGSTNTGSLQVQIGGAAFTVYKDGAAGPTLLTGGEVVTGNVVELVYDTAISGFHLVAPQSDISGLPVKVSNTAAPATLAALLSAIQANGPQPGDLKYTASNRVPAGWLACDGTAVSRTGYAALFAAIGTTYGAGDGLDNFLLPDGRGYFIRSFDSAGAVDPGRAFGSTQQHALQNHIHSTSSKQLGGGGSVEPVPAGYDASLTAITSSGVQNANAAIETRPSNIAFLLVIKT